MRPSTFTKGDRYKLIAVFTAATALTFLATRHSLLYVLLTVFPALGVALLIMRTRILRHFAKTPIQQVAYVSLVEPVYNRYTINVGTDEDGNPITERRSEVVGYKRRDPPLKRYIDPCYVDFEEYIAGKGNPMVLVCGLPGMGKSELEKVLLLSTVKVPKIVFSFKPNDTHLRLPYPVIDVSRHTPNPFQDAEAFSIAYALAFPANLTGIMLSQVRAIVKSLARDSRDLKQFRDNVSRMKRKATDIQLEALALIEQQIESLAVGEGSFSIDLTKDVVMDFSRLEEPAKTFYAETALRQIWSSLTGRLPATGISHGMTLVRGGGDERPAPRVAIVIDEAWRLTQLYEANTRSVLDTIMLQVRQFGTLHTATQNYTDIPDNLGQFGTKLAFNTTVPKDLDAMSKIDPGYAWVVKNLRPHEFVDLSFRVEDDGLIPVFRADMAELPARGVEYAEPAQVTATTTTTTSRPTVAEEKRDYESEILDALKASPLHQTGIDKALGIEREDKARLKVKDALRRLVNAKEVGRIKYVDAAGKEKVLCYVSDPNLSPMHDYMQKEAAGVLRSGGVGVSKLNRTGSGSVADIETPGLDVEIETGLKHSPSDLAERLSRSVEPVVIVVPNYEEKGRYSKYASARVRVAVMSELLEAAKVLTAEGKATGAAEKEPPEGGRGADP